MARDKWDIVYFQERPGRVPADIFLAGCPTVARAELMATVVAVSDGPPPSFRGGQRWHVMKDEMSGICEARDAHNKVLYRLFCLLDRNGPSHGLTRPSLVLLDGGVKPEGTEMDASVYQRVARSRDRYLASNPRSVLK